MEGETVQERERGGGSVEKRNYGEGQIEEYMPAAVVRRAVTAQSTLTTTMNSSTRRVARRQPARAYHGMRPLRRLSPYGVLAPLTSVTAVSPPSGLPFFDRGIHKSRIT